LGISPEAGHCNDTHDEMVQSTNSKWIFSVDHYPGTIALL
jgi:hypothetical protein